MDMKYSSAAERMASKQGITCLNTRNNNADYRGEIKIILINLSSKNRSFNMVTGCPVGSSKSRASNLERG
jgi:dUTPase